jgi:Mrp family chromosome partitioning ATPase
MHDLRQDLDGLWRLLSRTPSATGGRVILFTAARAGDGTSSVASSFARLAAEKSARATWLVDLDIRRNTQYTAFAQGMVHNAGRLGHALDASLGTEQIYVVPGHERDLACARLLNAHQIGDQRLLVTRFRVDKLPRAQAVQLRSAPGWWRALRKAADWAIIDAPSIDKSKAGLAFAGQADGVVLVVKADETPAAEVARLRQDVEAHGGEVIGVVMNRLRDDARIAGRLEGMN